MADANVVGGERKPIKESHALPEPEPEHCVRAHPLAPKEFQPRILLYNIIDLDAEVFSCLNVANSINVYSVC